MNKLLSTLLLASLFSMPAHANHYRLVDVVHLKAKDFKGQENSKIYAEVSIPNCKPEEYHEIDMGDYLLGPDCFYGEPQSIEVREKKNKWRIYLPYCYSSHTYTFSRKIHVYCVNKA